MTPRLLRSANIIAGLVLAGAALASWSQSWFVVSLTGAFADHSELHVGGDAAGPAVAALALASGAGFAAMAISGAFFRTVLALLELLIAGSIVLSASLALASPMAAIASTVTDATGLAGADAVSQLVASASATAWPFVALCAGILLAVLGLEIMITGRNWPVSGRRFEPVRFEPVESVESSSSPSPVSDWDELSGGADPTSR